MLEEDRLKGLGQLYMASKIQYWREAYNLFNELKYAGKREFYTQETESSASVYDEMMDTVQEALAANERPETDIEETTNAFIYSANEDPDFDNFRNAASKVLEEEKRWEYYAEKSV